MSELKRVFKTLSVDKFVDGKLFVRENEHLGDLMDSIGEVGVLDPPVVMPNVDGTFEIINGHRRIHACKKLGIRDLRVEVVRGPKLRVYGMTAVDLLNKQLSPLEQASLFHKWTEELSLSEKDLAKIIQVTPQYISTRKGLLRLDESVKIMVRKGEIDPSHAELLCGFDKSAQKYLARVIMNKSVRDAERYLGQIRKGNIDHDIMRKMSVRVEKMPGPALTPQEERRAFEIMKRCPPAVRLLVQYPTSQDMGSESRGLKLGSTEIVPIPKGPLAPVFSLIQSSQVKCKHCGERSEVKLASLDFSILKKDLPLLENALRVAAFKTAFFRQHRRKRHDQVQYAQPRLHPLDILSKFLEATPGSKRGSEQGYALLNLAGGRLRVYWRSLFDRNMPEDLDEITRDDNALMWMRDDRRPNRPLVVELVWRAVKAARGTI